MKKAIVKDFDGIGSVLFEPSMRAKRLIISYKPDRGVRVAVPGGVSFKKAKKIFYAKLDLVKKHIDKVEWAKLNCKPRPKKIIEMDIEKACYKMAARLDELARKHGFTYRNISFRNQKTRWGSCSSKGNISLNVKLLALPQELMDYVLLHELVHTRVKNHSDVFWTELDKYVGDAIALRSKINKFNTVDFKIVHKPDNPTPLPEILPPMPENIPHKPPEPPAEKTDQMELF